MQIFLYLVLFFAPSIFLAYSIFILKENWKLRYWGLFKRAAIYFAIFILSWLAYLYVPYLYDISSKNNQSIEGVYQTEDLDTVTIDKSFITIKSAKDFKNRHVKYELMATEEVSVPVSVKAMNFYLYHEFVGFNQKIRVYYKDEPLMPKEIYYSLDTDSYSKLKESEDLWYRSNGSGVSLVKERYSHFLNPIVFYKKVN